MQSSLPPIVITSSTNTPLNAVYHGLLSAGVIELDIITKVAVTRLRTEITAHGDAPVSRIEIHLDDTIYVLSNHIELKAKLMEIIKSEGDAVLDDADILVFFKEREAREAS